MSDINEKEAEVLLKFRENLCDLKLDDEKNGDNYLIRWLRARDLNIKKAEDMLRKSLKWREENNIDNILEWKAPDKYKNMYPMEMCGYNKDGYPVCIVPSRFTDPDAIWQVDKHEYYRYNIQNMEKILDAAKKYSTPGNRIYQCVIIYDMDQVNFRPYMNRRYYSIMQESSELFNENYPEIIHKAYFLFSPKLFTVLFAMIKHVIPKKSIEKFKIYGINKESWTIDLLSHIPSDLLPIRYGGTNEEFEKTAFLNCKIPKVFSCKSNGSSNNNGLLEEEGEEDLIEANIPAGENFKLDYKIHIPKSTLKWNFKTIDHDIGFSIHLDGEELNNYGRVESHKKRQEGLHVCEKEGEYTLVFENTYSRIRSKTIWYRVEIEIP